MKVYSVDELTLVVERYCQVTGQATDDCLHWLTASPEFIQNALTLQYPTRLMADDSSVAQFRMDMMLHPHWYTLLKIHLIQHEGAE